MEEDPTPVPSVGSRKHLITNEEGVITGEETLVDLGHTESGYVHPIRKLMLLPQEFSLSAHECASTQEDAIALLVFHRVHLGTSACKERDTWAREHVC